MRPDPLAYLSSELDSLKQQGLYRPLRVLDDEQKPSTTVDHHHVVNLSSNNYLGTDHASAAAGARARGHRAARRRLRIGSHDCRHHGDSHGAGATARGVQEDRGGGRLPERVHGERGHGVVDPDEGRRRHLRRTESREHHRRLSPEPCDDQGVPAQGRRRRPHNPEDPACQRSASC